MRRFPTAYQIKQALHCNGWDCSVDEGRLMALELLCKAAAGFYNSRTEEGFLAQLGLTTKARKPNAKGFKFICDMVYASSNKKPDCYALMQNHRQ